MSDYFALLDQPRRPWLDADELKQAFHAKSLRAHPDASASAGAGEFEQVNEAYQVLLDPKRRLQHLLGLLGEPPTRLELPPPAVASFFPMIANLTREADLLLEKAQAATSALSRSLLKPAAAQLAARLQAALEQIDAALAEAEAELRHTSMQWRCEAPATEALYGLYLRFAYLTRWRAELDDRGVRLG